MTATDTDTGHQVAQLAATARETVQTITRLTSPRPPIPAPTAYQTLIDLEEVAYQLGQALFQLGDALGASLTCYDVYEDDPTRDPHTSVLFAQAALDEAAGSALLLGGAVGIARNAIAGQGYHDHPGRADR
jgi:hypothetical protein